MANDIAKKRAALNGGIAGMYNEVGPVQGPSLSSIFAEHMAALPKKTEDNLRHQQDVMDKAYAGDPEAMKEFTEMVSGIGGIIKSTNLTELMELIKQRGGIEAAKRLEKAADLVPNLEHQYQPQALKEAFTGNRSIVSVMNPADFEKYAAPISSETKSSLSKSRRIGEPGPGQDYTHMPLGTYNDYINYLQQFSAPGGGGFRSMPYLQLGQRKGFSFPNIQGHEGRHRTDALARQGNQSTLSGIDPRPDLRELPRNSQEEYLNALASEVGGRSPFVMPQQSEVSRGLIELPEMFAQGGSVQCMSEGSQPDPIPIQKNNPLTEQAANKALVEIAKRKALYEIAQMAEQERARQAASRMKTSSVSPSVMPASLEPSGNGGPMLNNPLNR